MKYTVVGVVAMKSSTNGNPRLMLDLVDEETNQKVFEVPTKVYANFCYRLVGKKIPYQIDAVVKEYYGRLQMFSAQVL